MSDRPHIVRRMYDWVLGWAGSPYGTWALFLLSFAESSFFPIPPDPLLIALCLGNRNRSLWYSSVCSAGSVLGGMFGYLLGVTVWDEINTFCYEWVPGLTPEAEAWFRGQYDEKGFWIVFLAGFTPIPYKVFTIVSGALHMNFAAFVLASVIGRSARFFLVGGLIWRFGAPISDFIDRYFDKLSLAFAAALVGGFVVIKMLF